LEVGRPRGKYIPEKKDRKKQQRNRKGKRVSPSEDLPVKRPGSMGVVRLKEPSVPGVRANQGGRKGSFPNYSPV